MEFDLKSLKAHYESLDNQNKSETQRRETSISVVAQSLGLKKSVCEKICDDNPQVYSDTELLMKLIAVIRTWRSINRYSSHNL